MTAFATLVWLNARQLRAVALVSVALLVAWAVVVTGSLRLGAWFWAMGDYVQPACVIPLLFGAGVAAPMLAREQQRRTIDFAYTQSMSRARWLAARILPVPVLAILVWAGARAVFRLPAGNWMMEHFWIGDGYVRLGFLLFTVALGFCAGAVLGRTLPAMAVTVVGFLLVWYGGVMLPVVRFFVPYEHTFTVDESPATVSAYAVVLCSAALLLLAITFVWMTRKVPRS